MTQEQVKTEKYYFISKTKKTPFKSVNDHIKSLGGFFNGSGWCVPFKHKDKVEEICSIANTWPNEMILEGSFDKFRQSHSLAFYNEKSIKIQFEIDKIKRTLNLDDLSNNEFPECLNETEEGKTLLDLLERKKEWEDQIARVKSEQKVVNIIEESYKHILELNSLSQIRSDLKAISSDVKTGFSINGEPLELPGGALTILAGPTSHGKTAFLINLALGVIKQHEDKKVIFISYEEARASILTLFMNTWIGHEFSKNNRKTIRHFLRTESTEYVKSGNNDDENLKDVFIKNINAFEKHILANGRLHVCYSEMLTEHLVEAIRYIKSTVGNAIIFIDYMQFLKSKNSSRSRQEELKEICYQLKDCAVDTGLPIVLAAQFNRRVLCEADLSLVNIGEAGDIERAANMVIGFWNRSFKGFSKIGNESKSGGISPEEPALYVEIMKRRGDRANVSDVLDFNGNTGKISNRESTFKPTPKPRTTFG